MRIRVPSLAVGIVSFLGAHAIEVARWQAWFEPPGGADVAPWFLNSGRALAFMALALFAAGGLATAFTRSPMGEARARGYNVAAGAFAAMVVVLFAGDPGTIFPIVLAFGAVVAIASSLAGATVTTLLVRALGNGPRVRARK